MLTYTLYRTATGDISSALVQCSDGTFAGTDPALTDAASKAYQAWLAAGNQPGAPVTTQADLALYANERQWALATGGYTMTIAGQALTFSTDTASQALITGKYIRLTQANPPATISWQFPSGFVAISMADFQKVASAVADFIQATFDALEQVFAAIAAGTITTTVQVDAAAWPSAVASS